MSSVDILLSANLCSIVHFLAFAFIEAPIFLQFTHLLACYTSLQRHVMTHTHSKWVNRIVTSVAFIMDLYYSRQMWSFQAMIWIATGAYTGSKLFESEGLYIFAQWLVTVCHVLMYVWYNTTGNFNKIRV
jgi:hypothetical protein